MCKSVCRSREVFFGSFLVMSRRSYLICGKLEALSNSQWKIYSFFLLLFLSVISWNEWLPVPVKYSELPRDAVLALTIWDVEGTSSAIPVGGTNISLFGKHG